MILKPHRDANHQLVVTTLALLELDHPEHAAVIRSLAVTLYGARILPVYDALLREFVPAPAAASIRESLS
jgi:hypothetical protein